LVVHFDREGRKLSKYGKEVICYDLDGICSCAEAQLPIFQGLNFYSFKRQLGQRFFVGYNGKSLPILDRYVLPPACETYLGLVWISYGDIVGNVS